MTLARPIALWMAIVAALGLPLAGCGKKGDLAPPPSHADPAEDPGTE